MEAAQGFEPWITDLQSAALVHLAMPPYIQKHILSCKAIKSYIIFTSFDPQLNSGLIGDFTINTGFFREDNTVNIHEIIYRIIQIARGIICPLHTEIKQACFEKRG